ncbi:hypothetical protein KKB54_05745 [bacterium]|nr:hypothetical protein [bacterium]MBU0900296.1 hypothetical protein [bacterium]MBU1153370.1 hypothetical protein [bacterium]MBU1781950.1 hypothetical protein [bacterium]
MLGDQSNSALYKSLSFVIQEEINKLKQVFEITLKIEKSLQENEPNSLEDLVYKRGEYIQFYLQLANQELALKKQNQEVELEDSNISYLNQLKEDYLRQIKETELKAEVLLKQLMKETKKNLTNIYKYRELRKTYVKESGKFFNEAFFIDKKK